MRFHYLLTYAPANDVMDGKFRTISVEGAPAGRRRCSHAAATAPSAPRGMRRSWPTRRRRSRCSTPARCRTPSPSQATAFAFPEADRPGLTPVVVRVTTDNLQFDIDEKKAAYNAQAAVVVRDS